MKSIPIKIDEVFAYLYLPVKYKNSVIYLKGGPYSPGDNGKSKLGKIAEKNKYVFLFPDYIGYFRSDGVFGFKSCIKTIALCNEFLTGKRMAVNLLTNKQIKLKSKKVVLVGSSWGGAIAPFFNFYQPSTIKHLGLIKPVTDWDFKPNKKFNEEDIKKTRQIIINQYKNVYRGFKGSIWNRIFQRPMRKYNPIDNITTLNGLNVYILHGNKDKSIHWSRSYKFYKSLSKLNSKRNTFWTLLKNATHSERTNLRALDLILKKFY